MANSLSNLLIVFVCLLCLWGFSSRQLRSTPGTYSRKEIREMITRKNFTTTKLQSESKFLLPSLRSRRVRSVRPTCYIFCIVIKHLPECHMSENGWKKSNGICRKIKDAEDRIKIIYIIRKSMCIWHNIVFTKVIFSAILPYKYILLITRYSNAKVANSLKSLTTFPLYLPGWSLTTLSASHA